MAVPVSRAYGGDEVVIDPVLTYTIAEVGWLIMFGAGATFLGVALITAAVGAGAALPAWLRWFTLVVGVIGLASLAWLPFFALVIWALIVGIWSIAAARREDAAPEAQPAS